MFCMIPKVQQSSFEKIDVNQGSQLEMMHVGSP